MGGEPWLFTPAEIGALTDRQIWEQYVRPHVRRHRRAGRRGRGAPGRRRRDRSALPTRDEYILVGERLGLPREHLEKEYDGWAASAEGVAALAKDRARTRKGKARP